MATIDQDLQQIRHAVYGEEVREAIADAIEHCDLMSDYACALNYSLIQYKFISYDTGEEASFSDERFFASDWIPVQSGKKIYINHYRKSTDAADYAGVAFYNIGRSYISGRQYTPPNSALELTVPSNAAYMRCTYFSDVGEQMVIRQSTYTAKEIALVGHQTIIQSAPAAPYDNADTIPAGTVVTYIRGSYPSNVPVDFVDPTSAACTIVTINYNKDRFGGRLQIFTDRRRFLVRMADNEASYSPWLSLSDSIGYAINNQTTFVAPFADADTIPAGTTVCYIGRNFKPAHYPAGIRDISICRTYNYAQHAFGGKLQIASDDKNMWFRLAITETSYKPWVLLTDGSNSIHTESAFPLFENVGVIGDSYASGALYQSMQYGADHYSISWPQIIARKNGIHVTNFTKGGLTTRSWLTDSKGLPLLQSESAKDLYICVLGINDNAVLGANYLGTVSDIDSQADTFYGNYGKIINAIKAKAPNAKIVISTMAPSAPGANVSIYNEAIVTISEHFAIPCMVQGDDPFFTSDQYINNIRYNHPLAGGYAHMANAFDRMLCKAMDDNVEYFANYGRNKS